MFKQEKKQETAQLSEWVQKSAERDRRNEIF